MTTHEEPTLSLGEIVHTNVVEQVIERIRTALIHRILLPGQRLPSETELAAQMGVGRSAIREAMKVLEALGVLHIERGRGTFIADQPSPAMLSSLVFAVILSTPTSNMLFELRTVIQKSYCVLASSNALPDDWTHIENAAAALEHINAASAAPELLTQLDLAFHFAVLDATHNPLIIRIGRTIEELFFVSISKTLTTLGQPQNAIEAHRSIIKAMRSGDVMAIHSAIDHSLSYWQESLVYDNR